MIDWLFHFFATLTLVSAVLMVTSRNPVNSAMFMIVTFVGTAALFVTLEAYFLAILQVLVYAGAIVVLFLFIIMLLNVDRVTQREIPWMRFGAALCCLLLMIFAIGALFVSGHGGPPVEKAPESIAAFARNFGYLLFTKYMLPFQLTGFLLLMAMVGVIVISKRSPDNTHKNKKNSALTTDPIQQKGVEA